MKIDFSAKAAGTDRTELSFWLRTDDGQHIPQAAVVESWLEPAPNGMEDLYPDSVKESGMGALLGVYKNNTAFKVRLASDGIGAIRITDSDHIPYLVFAQTPDGNVSGPFYLHQHLYG